MTITTEKPSVLALLHSSTLFNALNAEEIESLAAVARVLHVERGEMIWFSGDEVDFFGLAGTGFVKMVRSCGDGTEATMELMGPGQIFGLMGTVLGNGCPLQAVAVTDLWYLRIPKRAFLPIYERNSALKDRLLRKLAVRFHGQVDLMARMSNGTVDQRIAAILFILAESYGQSVAEGIRLDVPLTRQEIAEMSGTTVESAIRTMSRWQKQGLIETDRQRITLRDEKALSEILKG
jgi:CRP/FNR family transcriptional regulator, nitrogen oxide reductase regulator